MDHNRDETPPMPQNENSNNQSLRRFTAIDGLRGMAALSVVLFHFSSNLKPGIHHFFPGILNTVMSYGYLGVPVFFVISGFVISLSVGDARISPNYALTFILRRNIRLNPAYWASIVFSIVLLSLKNRFAGTFDLQPSLGGVFAHMFYLQDLLSVKPVISAVYWTLCLEVQLYLLYILTVWLSQKISSITRFSEYRIHVAMIVPLGIYSTLMDLDVVSLSIPGLCIASWHYFLMGVLINDAFRKKHGASGILAFWLLFETACQTVIRIKTYTVAGLVFSVLILVVRRFDGLGRILGSTFFQYLGKLSYTVYLVHPAIGWNVISSARYLLKDDMPPMAAGFVFVLCTGLSLMTAHVFHVLFEKPSLRLCARLKDGVDLQNLFMKREPGYEIEY